MVTWRTQTLGLRWTVKMQMGNYWKQWEYLNQMIPLKGSSKLLAFLRYILPASLLNLNGGVLILNYHIHLSLTIIQLVDAGYVAEEGAWGVCQIGYHLPMHHTQFGIHLNCQAWPFHCFFWSHHHCLMGPHWLHSVPIVSSNILFI